MHYRNGRQAAENDPVIMPNPYNMQKFVAGTIYNLSATSTTCNGTVAVAVPGGVNQVTVTVGDCCHAEDAYAAIEKTLPAPNPIPGPHVAVEPGTQ